MKKSKPELTPVIYELRTLLEVEGQIIFLTPLFNKRMRDLVAIMDEYQYEMEMNNRQYHLSIIKHFSTRTNKVKEEMEVRTNIKNIKSTSKT